MKKRSLLEDVREILPDGRPGFLPWHARLKPEDRAEVEEIRGLFVAGQLGTKAYTLARALSTKLAERGLADVKPQTISRWLRNKD